MKTRTYINTVLICTILLQITSCNRNNKIISNSSYPYNSKADSIINLMTIEEKIGQLNLPSSGDITTGQAQSSDIAKKIEEGKVGGLFNYKFVKKIREVKRNEV